jgi:pimeloyl-ACP methyl ester carboxylesterase
MLTYDFSPVGRRSHRGDHPAAPAACAGHGRSDRAPGRSHRRGRRTGGARDHRHRSSPHLEGGRGARFGGDAAADWYPAALRQLASLGIPTKLVSLLPAPTTLGIDETVAAIAKAVGDNPQEITQTILIGHSVGSQALLAYLSRHGAHRTFAGLVSVAGWFTVVGEHGPQFRVDRLGGRTDHRAPVGQ